jgi:hypothetical protein
LKNFSYDEKIVMGKHHKKMTFFERCDIKYKLDCSPPIVPIPIGPWVG